MRTGARLAESDQTPQSRYEEYFEIRYMGATHEAACMRTGFDPRTLLDRIEQARDRGMVLPRPPEGYSMTSDWNEPQFPGVRTWLREGMDA